MPYKAMRNKHKIVIVVDDDSFFANLVAKMFTNLKWQAALCFSMEDALQLVERDKIDLVVTDIFMPGIGGIEGIRLLREKFPGTPIIAMTGGWEGMSPDKTVEAAVKVGADLGLPKPFTANDLTAALENLDL